MSKFLKISCYIISTVLLTTYLIILYTATVPKVPYEYQLYYISKSLQDWPGYNGLKYNLGDIISLTTDNSSADNIKRRGYNWNAIEEDGCWTFGEQASLYFTDIDSKALYGCFDVSDIRNNCSADVYANNTFIGKINAEGFYSFEIPQNSFYDRQIEISFVLENYGSIGTDSRNQGIKLRRFLLSEDKVSFN